MLEQEWPHGDPGSMLAVLSDWASPRQLRLFACACCRRVWHLITVPHCRAAVIAAEAFADSELTEEQLKSAERLAHNFRSLFADANRAAALAAQPDAAAAAAESSTVAAQCLSNKLAEAAQGNARAADCAGAPAAERQAAWARYDTVKDNAYSLERSCQAQLLLEFFPEAFPNPQAAQDWPTTVRQLAQSLYAGQDCAFALRDALLEVGHIELGEHFAEAFHPRGCWALDRVLRT